MMVLADASRDQWLARSCVPRVPARLPEDQGRCRCRWASGAVPDPQGKPGYLRVDTVHPGDLEGVKGVYYLQASMT